MPTDTCVFCRIVAGEIPAATVYEDEQLLAFLDIAPINKGHALLIPKQHYVSLTSLPPALCGHLFQVVPRLAAAVMRASGADGFNLLLSNGSVAGQVVPHTHLHIIPRLAADGIVLPARSKPYADAAERQTFVDAIRARLKQRDEDGAA